MISDFEKIIIHIYEVLLIIMELKMVVSPFWVSLLSIVSIERLLFAYNEYLRLRSKMMNDIGTIESCHRLNYRDIAREHVDLCDTVSHRLNVNIMTRVLTNTVNNLVYRPVSINTFIEISIVCACSIIIAYTYQHIHHHSQSTAILPTNRLKND